MGQPGQVLLGIALVLGTGAQLAWGGAAGGISSGASKETPYGVTTSERPTYEVDPAGCVTADCHVDVKAYKILHGPVNVNTCDACHRLTSAKAHTFELAREKADLCTYCHEFDTGMLPVVHKPVMTGECLGCHNPHGGTDNRMIREAGTAQLCGRCHESVTYGKKSLHQPVQTGQCDACHRPHASKYPKLLLLRAFPTEFYQRFSADKYDLCFGCHNEQLAEYERTTDLTNFRNGDRNLHFVHVNKGEYGRTCRACHSTHASKYDLLIRDWVPFGKWHLPIAFQKTPTGGVCETGCHPAFSYDRENPVAPKATAVIGVPPSASVETQNPASLHGVSASPRVPVADEREPIVVNWSARTVGGTEVQVPTAERPSVLLFLRADQAQSRQVVKMVSAAMPQIDQAQVVVVFSGPQAEEHANAFAGTKAVSWPILADPEYVLSKPLGVAVWPAMLVVQDDGVLVTHVGGAPLSLTVELKAYLDLATGKIDRETLNRRLAQRDLVGDGPVERATWHLQMGRILLAEGKTEEARAILADGLRFQPASVELRVELIRTLADLKQAEQGMSLLEQLPAGAMPTWERDLLRGRMLAALGQWDEARRLAVAVLKEKPDLGEAHYLMGMVYEHDRNWEKAAQEYRAAHARGR